MAKIRFQSQGHTQKKYVATIVIHLRKQVINE